MRWVGIGPIVVNGVKNTYLLFMNRRTDGPTNLRQPTPGARLSAFPESLARASQSSLLKAASPRVVDHLAPRSRPGTLDAQLARRGAALPLGIHSVNSDD